MGTVEWLIWGALVLLVFWAYQALDLALYWRRLVCRKPPPKRVPHWARHGHIPPTSHHGKHRR